MAFLPCAGFAMTALFSGLSGLVLFVCH